MANICEKCNHKHICGFQDDQTLACNHFQKEVVRCKDCKYLEITGCYGECRRYYLGIVKPWDFCSNGERREGE